MRPRTSRLVPLLNTGLAPFTARRDADRYLHKILDRLGTSPGEDPEFIDGMRFLLREVAQADRLSPLGWLSFTGDIKARIANRARIRRRIAECPAILDERIERPIVVVGLPRTATTLAHRILAAAPGARGPALWEWGHTDLALPEAQRRKAIRSVDNAMRVVGLLAPALRDIHPQSAEAADECAFLLPHGEQHLARTSLPGYESWLATYDFGPDYEYHRQALQVLQYGRERRRWVLKCPTHLGRLDLILRLYPDALIVWTHRDPAEVVGSIASLVEASRGAHQHRLNTDDLHDIGRMVVTSMSGLVDKGRTARTGIPRDQIIDLRYPELTADPLGKVEWLYGQLDLEWTAADEDRVRAATEYRPGRPHEYALDRYGLTPADIKTAFGDYGRLAEPPVFGSGST
ncbi:sulfotransferase [Glycomyces sp. NPDC047010]|uniref:sulfotransferase family protein n=1 Tax=Glycomyces sp. NPDC047010 TaxID=3155023 RepID=UPI0033E0A3C1